VERGHALPLRLRRSSWAAAARRSSAALVAFRRSARTRFPRALCLAEDRMRIALLADWRPRQVVQIAAPFLRIYKGPRRQSQLSIDAAEQPSRGVGIRATCSKLRPLNEQPVSGKPFGGSNGGYVGEIGQPAHML